MAIWSLLLACVAPAGRADTTSPTAVPSQQTQPDPSASGASSGPAPAGSAAAPQPGSVTLTPTSINPRSPDPSKLAQPVTITATLANSSDTTYSDFTVGLERGLPITQQSALDAALQTPPATDTLANSHEVDQNNALPPHSSVDIAYRTNPDFMCLCYTAVYPYALVVRATTSSGADLSEIARAQIMVPSFLETTKPVLVSWVWPLIDRPHRGLSATVFDDDDLAGSVSKGGRLDRALSVAERTAGRVRMLLVVDPELLDSLAVMSSPAGYRYKTKSSTAKGVGGPAAAAWLKRLAALRAKHDIVLTAYADPDINAVTRAGLPWSTALDPQVQARIGATLNDFTSDVTWPADGALTSKALDAAIGGGSSTLLLNDAALAQDTSGEPRPDAISPLPSATGQALALVTDTQIEQTVDQAMRLGAFAAQSQQTLLGQLAIRAAQDETRSHFVVVTPGRYIDTDPAIAAQTVLATVGTSWSRSISVRSALATITPVDRGPLRTAAATPGDELPAAMMAQVLQTSSQVASFREALTSEAAAALLAGFNAGIQRAESNAWRVDRGAGQALLAELSAAISTRLRSVDLVRPTAGTYSLSSADSPVIVTVENKLAQDVSVRVSVAPAPGVIGFKARAIGVQVINANSTRTISIPAHADRLGKFDVVASLSTPDGQPLGRSISLSLRATALGGITKTITVVAASVLILALLRRVVKRVRRGLVRRPAAGAAG